MQNLVKIRYQEEIHRIILPKDLRLTRERIVKSFQKNLPGKWNLKYEDHNNNFIEIISNQDFSRMLKHQPKELIIEEDIYKSILIERTLDERPISGNSTSISTGEINNNNDDVEIITMDDVNGEEKENKVKNNNLVQNKEKVSLEEVDKGRKNKKEQINFLQKVELNGLKQKTESYHNEARINSYQVKEIEELSKSIKELKKQNETLELKLSKIELGFEKVINSVEKLFVEKVERKLENMNQSISELKNATEQIKNDISSIKENSCQEKKKNCKDDSEEKDSKNNSSSKPSAHEQNIKKGEIEKPKSQPENDVVRNLLTHEQPEETIRKSTSDFPLLEGQMSYVRDQVVERKSSVDNQKAQQNTNTIHKDGLNENNEEKELLEKVKQVRDVFPNLDEKFVENLYRKNSKMSIENFVDKIMQFH